MRPQLYLPLLALLSAVQVGAAVEFPSTSQPGKAQVSLTEKQATLGNELFTATFGRTSGGVVFKGMKTADAFKKKNGPVVADLKVAEGPVRFDKGGACKLTFRYAKGSHKLNLVGVQLLQEGGKVVAEDIHAGTMFRQSGRRAIPPIR